MRKTRSRVGIALVLTLGCSGGGGQFGHFEGKVRTEWIEANRKMQLLCRGSRFSVPSNFLRESGYSHRGVKATG
jgi:hypothetical protein